MKNTNEFSYMLLYIRKMAGYDFYIIVQGKKEGKWHELKRFQQNGSGYSFVDSCYFFCEKDRVGPGERSDGWLIYIFTYETLKADIEKYRCSFNLKLYLKNISNRNIITNKDIKELQEYIMKNDYPNASHLRDIAELIKYYELCTEYKTTYDDVKVIYGFRENRTGFN